MLVPNINGLLTLAKGYVIITHFSISRIDQGIS